MFEVRNKENIISYHKNVSDAIEAAKFMSRMEQKIFEIYNQSGKLIKEIKNY